MAKWLFKEEPEHYSFEMLERDRRTVWDGVRNNLALKNLRMVKRDEEIVYYHTGDVRAAVGIAAADSDSFIDSDGFPVVRIRAGQRFRRPVTLSEIRAAGKFNNTMLVRIPRLSVMELEEPLWQFIVSRGL
jgi:predicted RNA-binding protein with PUA-like domain